MIVVSGAFRADPDRHDEMVELATTMRAATLDEDGCTAYSFWVDATDGGLFHVFEEWDDEAALTAHTTTPHFRSFVEAMPRLGIHHAEIWHYHCSASRRIL